MLGINQKNGTWWKNTSRKKQMNVSHGILSEGISQPVTTVHNDTQLYLLVHIVGDLQTEASRIIKVGRRKKSESQSLYRTFSVREKAELLVNQIIQLLVK